VGGQFQVPALRGQRGLKVACGVHTTSGDGVDGGDQLAGGVGDTDHAGALRGFAGQERPRARLRVWAAPGLALTGQHRACHLRGLDRALSPPRHGGMTGNLGSPFPGQGPGPCHTTQPTQPHSPPILRHTGSLSHLMLRVKKKRLDTLCAYGILSAMNNHSTTYTTREDAMAWSRIPQNGPDAACNPPTCSHVDCADQVRIIRTDCAVCGESIRYEKFSADATGRLAHFACLLKLAGGA